jgi:hypothetical protein
MGVFGWQLVRSSSPKYLLHPPVFPRVAGEFYAFFFFTFFHFMLFTELSSLLPKKMHKGLSANSLSSQCLADLFLSVRYVKLSKPSRHS